MEQDRLPTKRSPLVWVIAQTRQRQWGGSTATLVQQGNTQPGKAKAINVCLAPTVGVNVSSNVQFDAKKWMSFYHPGMGSILCHSKSWCSGQYHVWDGYWGGTAVTSGVRGGVQKVNIQIRSRASRHARPRHVRKKLVERGAPHKSILQWQLCNNENHPQASVC